MDLLLNGGFQVKVRFVHFEQFETYGIKIFYSTQYDLKYIEVQSIQDEIGVNNNNNNNMRQKANIGSH